MTAESRISQAFNGLSYGVLLFLLASGLSLIFGVMRVVNLAHGSYGSYTMALVCGALALALIGIGRYSLSIQAATAPSKGWLPLIAKGA